MKKPIITVLLSYGLSGKIFHAPFLETNLGFELYGVLERNEKKAILDYPNIKSFSTINDLLSDEKIELVVVNTPNNLHFEHSKLILKAGKNVLLEKPATTTPEEYIELLELAKKVNRKLFVYQNRRWSSDFLATKKVIESRKLGNIIEVHIRFDRFRPTIGTKLFKENKLPSSGIWYDLGSHLIDQAISIFGKPEKYFGTKTLNRKDTQVEDFAFMHIIFPEKINVFITTSMLVLDAQPGIIIHGTKGTFVKDFCDEQENQLMNGLSPTNSNFGIELPNREGKLTYINDKNETTIEKINSIKGNFNGLFDELYQSIRHKKEFQIRNEQIIEQLKLLL
jgi:scyllo-inositol 2-dehydrogenase (NADP+)